MKIKNIGIFCGASKGALDIYERSARQLADCFLDMGITLIYGGAQVGLMGVLADHMLKRGGKAVGVIPELLLNTEIPHKNLTQLHIVKSMDERKKLISTLSDAFILLPGGIGSLDEFFEMLTLAQLGQHNKPRGILNTANYYEHLLKFLNHSVDQLFWNTLNRDRMIVEQQPDKLLASLFRYNAPVSNRWHHEEPETV